MSTLPHSRANAILKARDGWGWLIIAVFWTVLWLMGHPIPTTDDLWYIGASLNLADGKPFVNPYCSALGSVDGQNLFYAYVPLYNFVLAGWLKVLGVSAATMTGFQALVAAWSSAALWRVMRGSVTGLFLPIGACIAVLTLASGTGLRPDAMGLAAFALGLWLLRDSSRLAWAMCSCCLWLADITCPNYAFLGLFVLAVALVNLIWGQRMFWKEIAIRLGWVAASWAAVTLLMLRLIDFHLSEFLKILNASRARSSSYAIIGHFIGSWADGWTAVLHLCIHLLEPAFFLLLVVGLAYTYRKHFKVPLGWPGYAAVAAGIALVYLPALTSAGAGRLPTFYATVAALYFLARLQTPFRVVGIAAWYGLVLFSLALEGRCFVQFCTLQFAPVKVDPAAVRQQMETIQGDHLYADTFAIRRVYDYRLPPGILDYHFGLQNFVPNLPAEDFPPNSVLLVSVEAVAFMERLTFHPDTPRPKSSLVRAVYPWTVETPYEFVVIRTSPTGSIDKILPLPPQR